MTSNVGKRPEPSWGDARINMVDADVRSDAAVAIRLVDLARINLIIGLWSFGGGLVSWFAREFSERRRWVDYRDLLSGFALSQLMPGPSTVNLTLYFGFMLKGLLGAIVAWSALVVPPSLLVVGIYTAYTHAPFARIAQFSLEGIAAAAAGLNIATGINAGRRSSDWRAMAIAAAVFTAVAVFRVPILGVVLVAAPISLAVAWRGEEKRQRNE